MNFPKRDSTNQFLYRDIDIAQTSGNTRLKTNIKTRGFVKTQIA